MRLDLARFRPRPDGDEERGVTIHGYRLERITDREANARTVYEASVASTGEPVRVTAFPIPEDPRLRRRVRRLARKRVAFRHPNVLPAREAFEGGGHLYLVTEPTDGPTLAGRLGQGSLEPRLAVRVLSQVADGVEAALAAGLTDSIISPAGIMLDASGRATLTDLGSATSLSELVQPWAHPHARYFSPELGQGDHLGARTSVYSLGCILFEALTGSPAYEGSWLNLSDLHSSEPIPVPSERGFALGAAIDAVIARALAGDPDERFSSAGDLSRAAAAALAEVEAPASRSAGASTQARPSGAPPPAPAAPEPTADAEREAREADAEREAREADAEREARVAAEREERATAAAAPAPEPEAKPAVAAQQRRRHGRGILLGCGLVAALAFGGYLVGTFGPDSGEVETVGPLSVELPAGWERRPAAGAVPGVRFDGGLAAAPRGSADAVMVAGLTGGADLLPPGLERSGGEAAEAVRLGRFDARRHRGVTAAGAPGEIVAYSVSTTEGTVAVACHASPAAARDFMGACERVASTLQLKGPRAISVPGQVAQDRRVAETLAALGERRSAARRLLAGAPTSEEQASIAGQLEAAYRDARTELERVAATSGWARARELAAGLRRVEDAYGSLARAAQRRSGADYDGARQAVDGAEAGLGPLLARAGP